MSTKENLRLSNEHSENWSLSFVGGLIGEARGADPAVDWHLLVYRTGHGYVSVVTLTLSQLEIDGRNVSETIIHLADKKEEALSWLKGTVADLSRFRMFESMDQTLRGEIEKDVRDWGIFVLGALWADQRLRLAEETK